MHTTIDSATEVVSGIRFPEGNRWHDGRLWYSDMHTGEVFSLDPVTDAGPRSRRRSTGSRPGSAGCRTVGWSSAP